MPPNPTEADLNALDNMGSVSNTETKPMCPTCGAPVRVVSGGEGTSFYEPLASTQPSSETTTNPQSKEAASAAPEGVVHDH